MNEYKFIINPITGRKVNVYGNLGQNILKNYLRYGMVGSGKETIEEPKPKSNIDLWNNLDDEEKCNFCLKPEIKEMCASRKVELEKKREATYKINQDKIKSLLESAKTMKNHVDSSSKNLQFSDAESALIKLRNILLEASEINNSLPDNYKNKYVEKELESINNKRPNIDQNGGSNWFSKIFI